MDFEFTRNDANLTKPVAAGGCGLTIASLANVTTWQTQDYKFNYHTGYHGEGANHYVYVHDGSKGKSMCRIFINGPKAGTTADCGYIKKKLLDDAIAVVTANAAIFLQIAKNQG